MKKVLALLLAVVLGLSMLAGCSSSDGESETPSKNVDPAQLADDTLAALAPAAEMVEVSEKVLSNYYTVDSKVVKSYKIYVSSAWTAEEVAIFRLVDSKQETIDAANEMIQKRIDDLTASYDGYLPEQLAVLEENSVVYQQGDMICFVSGSADGVAAAMKVMKAACE